MVLHHTRSQLAGCTPTGHPPARAQSTDRNTPCNTRSNFHTGESCSLPKHVNDRSCALPVMGTNRTGASISRVKPVVDLVKRIMFWSLRPTGATSRPFGFNCSSSGCGTWLGGAAVRTIAS